MADNEPAHDEKHEGETANTRAIALGAATLVGLLVLSLLLIYGVMGLLSARRLRQQGAPSPVRPMPLETNEPALNPDQPQQLQQLRAAEVRQLSSYGWVDERGGIAHVPIERAMELFVEEHRSPPNPSQRQESTP